MDSHHELGLPVELELEFGAGRQVVEQELVKHVTLTGSIKACLLILSEPSSTHDSAYHPIGDHKG